jgi:hypothetical protein
LDLHDIAVVLACTYSATHTSSLPHTFYLLQTNTETETDGDREKEILDRVYSRLIAVLTKALRYSFFPYSASASNT